MPKDVILDVTDPSPNKKYKKPPSILMGLFSSALIYFGLFAPDRLTNSLFEWMIDMEAEEAFHRLGLVQAFVNANYEFEMAEHQYKNLRLRTQSYAQIVAHTDSIKGWLPPINDPDFVAKLPFVFKQLQEDFPASNVTTQQLVQSHLFEYLDIISTPKGYSEAQNNYPSIPFLLSTQFAHYQGLLGYTQEFFQVIQKLATVTDSSTWSVAFNKTVLISYEPFAGMQTKIKRVNGLIPSISTTPFRELFSLLEDGYDAYTKTDPTCPGLQALFRNELRLNSQKYVDYGIAVVNILFGVFIELLLMKCFALNTGLPAEKATTLQAKIAGRSLLGLSFIFIPYLIHRVFHHHGIGPESLYLTCISLFALATPIIYRTWDNYTNQKLYDNLRKKLELLQMIMPDAGQQVTYHKQNALSMGRSLHDYEFGLKISRHENLNAFLMTQMIQDALTAHHLKIIRQEPKYIVFNSEFDISQDLAISIRYHILRNTEMAVDSQKLYEQLKRVNNEISQGILDYQAVNQYVYRYVLRIPYEYEACFEKVQEVFQSNGIELHGLEKHQEIYITGYKPASEPLFSELMAVLHRLRLSNLIEPEINKNTEQKSHKSRRKSLTMGSFPSASLPRLLPPMSSTQEEKYPIVWGSAKYDPNNPTKPSVWPFNAPGLPFNVFFICRTFKKEDFRTVEAYKHCKDKLKRAHWVQNPEAKEEGIVLLHGDPKGFFAKERLLGELSNTRVHASHEISETRGKILLKFFDVDDRAHQRGAKARNRRHSAPDLMKK